jgi:NADH-quinone oxidoreductase subunit K
MPPLQNYLILSALVFAIGFAGAVTRRNAILALVGIELMLNAANLNFIAFWRYQGGGASADGLLFALFAMGIAAAEAAVGLALIVLIYRRFRTVQLDELHTLKH